MDDRQAELFEKVRQQFDSAPYPRVALEEDPQDAYEVLFIHNLVTSYYLRNQSVTTTQGKVILDAGCGTGYKSLILAHANPGAKIIGVDLSSEAVELAKKRFEFHGVENAEFIVASIEDLHKLGYQFDYINCDEVLYLFPDIAEGLAAMKAVLKPEGIIRANLHSALQRHHLFRVQKVFQLMGLMESNPGDLEIGIAKETFQALKGGVHLRQFAWNQAAEQKAVEDDLWILMNYLFQGDKGWTIPDLFSALETADLEFLSMVNWRQWELLDLFADPDNLPAYWAMSLPEVPIAQRLELFELIQPMHRLLDFWCGHPAAAVQPARPILEWTLSDWQAARIQLHPQLQSAQIRQELIDRISDREPFVISQYVPLQVASPMPLKTPAATCLLPLWDGPQRVQDLIDRWLTIHPVDPVTLAPTPPAVATEAVINLLKRLELALYVLVS
jgi:2-polyprenyl-3-methyl-5-hydroxy-6-metoxy-1,4-benzoquinol methylase